MRYMICSCVIQGHLGLQHFGSKELENGKFNLKRINELGQSMTELVQSISFHVYICFLYF